MSDDAPHPHHAGDRPAAAPPLGYAPKPSAGRRALRRGLRLWPVWVPLLLVGLGVAYGPGAWRHYRLMRLQAACMTAELPADRPVYVQDYDEASALIAERPAEYRRDPMGQAERVDPRWAALAAAAGVAAWTVPPPYSAATAYCHERHTPDGRARLVVVEGVDR
ncbi:MAG: hypothetical protein ACAI43_18450, partial [Phycisphaerae bacterium]